MLLRQQIRRANFGTHARVIDRGHPYVSVASQNSGNRAVRRKAFTGKAMNHASAD
ncbi:hypothetical protein [Amycolatopsis sp. NPDC098790]|uniref:hypothetical protein n=1 Tax=Amycolatopsis sp. NPDC098790 TaxID=3363939 RepID=UPI0038159540